MHVRPALLALFSALLSGCGGGSGPAAAAPGAVVLALADSQVHVGSYHPVEVQLDPALGLTVEDLTFTVSGGPLAGSVSLSRERIPTARPTIMLLVGPRPGAYDLVATETAGGRELARLPFVSSTRWTDRDGGPSRWFTGTPSRGASGSAWGGGPGTPQNFEVDPALGVVRIAILLVDSASQRYTPEEATAARDLYLDHAVRGVDEGGTIRSAAAWYEEVSYGNLTLTAEAFGPFPLEGVFSDYIVEGAPQDNYAEACVAAADSVVDFADFDTIVCVMRTDETTDPARPVGAWPHAWQATGPHATDEGHFLLGFVSMASTNDAPNRRVFELLAHELGHTLGLSDQYRPPVLRSGSTTVERNIDAWGMMHADQFFSHLVGAHRMWLGWVDRTWVKTLDFSLATGPVDEVVRLEAIERGAPVAAPHNLLEIRIADGWNYYYELRSPQEAQIADKNLPVPGAVLGTDVATIDFPMERPLVLLVEHDADGDGSVLQAGGNHRATDVTDPSFPTDFRLEVTSIEDDVATLRVRYGVLDKPDPSIRPWPAGPDRPYQSPDIEIRNPRNAAEPSLANIPWANHPNTIAARITNRGNVAAQGVVVEFYLKGLTTGGAEEVLLGTDTQDIGPLATTEFLAPPWSPPGDDHFCVVVRIPGYSTPVGGVPERTTGNNVAQSNYARFISSTASPASRERASVIVGNPFPKRTRVFLSSSQTNPYYRTYIEHRWVVLDPGELRRVAVMFEHAGALPDLEPTNEPPDPADSNLVRIRAYVEDPREFPVHTAVPWDGIQVRVDTGRATQTVVDGDGGGGVFGNVRTLDDLETVADGRVIVSYLRPGGTVPEGHHVVPLKGGEFLAQAPSDWTALFATYLPPPGLAESDGTRLR